MNTNKQNKNLGERFDAGYYNRHYRNSRSAVTSRAQMKGRAGFIGAFARYMGLRVRSILDAGCGLGWLRTPLLREFRNARYVGLEASGYLCEQYGWVHGSLADHRPRTPFDLVVCYDVLQYLNDREASQAMANLGRLCRGVLYFSALTEEDWDFYCDQRLTDKNVQIRPGDWYRKRLARNFTPLGGGLYLRKGIDVQLWELERIVNSK